MKYILILIVLFSCKAKTYRIEQYFYLKGKNTEGKMWHDANKINKNTYTCKMPDGFNPAYGFDSVVFKIVETK